MNWDAIGAVGEILGALAVLVTLGYLAMQVNDTRKALRRSVSLARHEAMRDLATHMSEPGINAAIVKAGAPQSALVKPFADHAKANWGMTDEEVMALFAAYFMAWQTRLQFIPYVEDLDDLERRSFEGTLRIVYGRDDPQRVFYEKFVKPTQQADAIAYVESVLAKQP